MFKNFGKGKTIKAPVGFELIFHGFVVYALTQYATLLGNNFAKGQIYKISLDIFYFDRICVTIRRYLILP